MVRFTPPIFGHYFKSIDPRISENFKHNTEKLCKGISQGKSSKPVIRKRILEAFRGKDTLLTEEEKDGADRFLTRNDVNQMTVEKISKILKREKKRTKQSSP